MKKRTRICLLLIAFSAAVFSSCRKQEEPLLIPEPDETFSSYAAEKMETGDPEREGIIPEDSYLTKDFDPRSECYVCESEKRIYYVSGKGYLDHWNGNSQKYIFYADKDGKNRGVLCGDPDCQHSGTDCMACLGNDSVVRLSLYDGNLFLASKDGSDHPDIHIRKGGTDGSGFEEVGVIPAGSYEADTEGNWIQDCFFHRGYVYILSEKSITEEPENPYSSEQPVSTGLLLRVLRFPLENLNISEELYDETLTEEWVSAYPELKTDHDSVYLMLRLSREDPENWRNILSGALRMYRLSSAQEPEELYQGELPVMGGISVRDGEFRLTGSTFDGREIRAYLFEPETKNFREEMRLGTTAGDAEDFFSSFSYNGEVYFAIRDEVNSSVAEGGKENLNWRIAFYGENGALLSETVLNVGKTMEKLGLSAAEFGEGLMFYINPFSADRDAYYGLINIHSWTDKQYQAVLRIPVEDQEEWSIFLEGSKEK